MNSFKNKQTPFGFHLLALSITIIWGATFSSSKTLLQVLSPVEILLIRFILACIALFIIHPHIFRHGGGLRTEALFASAGFFGVTAYFLFENYALYYSCAANIGVILGCVVFFTGLAARICLGEALPRGFFVGFIVAISGISLISFSGSTELGLNPLGDILAIGACCSWAVYSVIIRQLTKRGHTSIQATRRILLWGIATALPCLLLENHTIHLQDLWSLKVTGNLLFLGLLATAGGYVGWNKALQGLGTVKATAYLYMTPGVSVLVAWLCLNDRITLMSGTGMVLATLGLVISEQEDIRRILHHSTTV